MLCVRGSGGPRLHGALILPPVPAGTPALLSPSVPSLGRFRSQEAERILSPGRASQGSGRCLASCLPPGRMCCDNPHTPSPPHSLREVLISMLERFGLPGATNPELCAPPPNLAAGRDLSQPWPGPASHTPHTLSYLSSGVRGLSGDTANWLLLLEGEGGGWTEGLPIPIQQR